MKGQLVTGDQARKTKRQHVAPCCDCPWARTALNGWLGDFTAEEWREFAHGEGEADCHTISKACAGLAMFRANVCKVPRDPKAFQLEPNRKLVFATDAEFMKHHLTPPPARE